MGITSCLSCVDVGCKKHDRTLTPRLLCYYAMTHDCFKFNNLLSASSHDFIVSELEKDVKESLSIYGGKKI